MLLRFLIGFVLYFVIVLVVASATTFLYSLLVEGTGVFDWRTSFTFAIILGIIFSWMSARRSAKKK